MGVREWSRGKRANAKIRYRAWIEREQAKNAALKKKGDDDWEEVKRLWGEAQAGRKLKE